MFIELTDILRCPEPHDEAYLVLIPDEMAERSVRTGRLGCPVCHREYLIHQGVADFGDAAPPADLPSPAIGPEALAAFLGLGGPGGYVGIVGGDLEVGKELVQVVPGVHFVLINPPPGDDELPMLSLLRAGSIPIKSRSLRGVVLLSPFAEAAGWRSEAARVLLPGLRVAGQGTPPEEAALDVLASADGWWVAQRD
jgi:uncharacterized protein YbaR (Trm112 family)